MYLRWIYNGALPQTLPKGHCPFGIPLMEMFVSGCSRLMMLQTVKIRQAAILRTRH